MAGMDVGGFAAALPYLRRQTARALDARAMTGEWLTPELELGCASGCWLHRAADASPRPVVFELHGGGFALGDARKGDALRAWVRDTFDVNVVGIEYRLAPEHPFPAALNDVAGTVRRIVTGGEIEVDPAHAVLMGYSAGANLAVAYALLSQRDDSAPLVSGLALHYPCLDVAERFDPNSVRACDLPVDKMAAFSAMYAGERDETDPLMSPVYAEDGELAALPPTVFCPVEGDALLPQAETLCRRMVDAGASGIWNPVAGVYHGYIEDAADMETFRAISMPETVAARPRGFQHAAARAVKTSLEHLLGPACHDVPFPGLEDPE